MLTMENADKALKEYYLEAVSAQLNDGISPFFAAIEKNADNVYGKDVKMAVVRGTCGNVVAGAEDGDLPAPYKNRYLSISVPLKNLYGTIEISDKAMRASRDSAGAFVNLVNAEMEGLVASAKQNFQRMLFGNGSGEMCKIVSDITDYEYKVDRVADYFVGMTVDVVPLNAASANDSYGLVITAVNRKTPSVTFSKVVTDVIANGKMYPHGSKDNELTGLGAIFDSASLYGYNKVSEPYFAPYKVDAAKSLTEEKLCEVMDSLEENFNSKVNMLICSFKTRRKIAALISESRRVVNTMDVNAGVGTVSVNGVPVYADKYCPDDRIMFVNTDDFSLNQLCDWEWLEDEDGKILKQIPGKAAYGATLVKYAELICKKPCGQGMLYNL